MQDVRTMEDTIKHERILDWKNESAGAWAGKERLSKGIWVEFNATNKGDVRFIIGLKKAETLLKSLKSAIDRAKKFAQI